MTASSEGGGAPNAYARFIPREELDAFSAWRPKAFGDARPASAAERNTEQQALRQAGYQDGYRDGVAALESFKQSFAPQMAAQLAPLVDAFDDGLAALEIQLADKVAQIATALARQVVRSELATRPEAIAQVASEAVHAVLLSARHIRVFVHPDDEALVQAGAGAALQARAACVLVDPALTRGGCRVESDLGGIDARIESRWSQAAETLGQSMTLNEERSA